jgi:hypothetical protein
MADLNAWSNGYEVVAATSEEEARALLKTWLTANRMDDDEDTVDGDGWIKLRPTMMIRDEDDGSASGTVATILAESSEPRHLWSVAH